jgi:hypothetical protein
MSDKVVAVQGGIGFPGALTLVFVMAKLWNAIDWSWWWVFSPLWIAFVVVFVIGLIVAAVAALK